MDTKMTEEISARFEELAALEHEFEDVEEEISKSQSHYYYYTNRAHNFNVTKYAPLQRVSAMACACVVTQARDKAWLTRL
jgi:hypothetical protein